MASWLGDDGLDGVKKSFGDTRCPRPTRKIMHHYVHSDLLCLCVYIIIDVYVYTYVYIYI